MNSKVLMGVMFGLIMMLSSCFGSGSGVSLGGDNGNSNGVNGFNSLVNTIAEPAGLNCYNGGIKVEYGLDDGVGGGTASNGILDPGEILGTEFVCNGDTGFEGPRGVHGTNGTNGSDGSQGPQGDQGPAGSDGSQGPQGDQGPAGSDGAAGADGAAGYNALTRTSSEPIGVNCNNGGIKIEFGLDNGPGAESRDGILEDDEVVGTATQYVCNGGNSDAKDIQAFFIGDRVGVISGTNIAVTVPYGAVTSLVPNIIVSEGASVLPASEAAQDFTDPVIYIVTAANGTHKDYTVTVTPAASNAKDIQSFSVFGYTGVIDEAALPIPTIAVTIPNSTHAEFESTARSATIGVSPGATVFPASGQMQLFNVDSPIEYLVFASDGSMKVYMLTVALGYTVSYDGNESTGGSVPTDPNLYKLGDPVSVLGNSGFLARVGYTFVAWNTDPDGLGDEYFEGDSFNMGDYGSNDVTLYAEWASIPTHTVTYDGNGNTEGIVPIDALSPYFEGATVTVIGNTGDLKKIIDPVFAAYSFAGWNTDLNGLGDSFDGGNTFSMGTEDVTLYAQWSIIETFEVSYDGNGNELGDVPAPPTSYLWGTPVEVLVLDNTGGLAIAGSTFAGWNTHANGSGTTYLPGSYITTPENHITLYAQWTLNPVITYNVIYDGNGGLNGFDPTLVDPMSPFPEGATVIVLNNVFIQAGYAFMGWYTNASGSGGTAYSPNDTFTITSDVTLYAQWASSDATVQSTIGTASLMTSTTGNIIGIPDGTTKAAFLAALTGEPHQVWNASQISDPLVGGENYSFIVTAQDGTSQVTYTVYVDLP